MAFRTWLPVATGPGVTLGTLQWGVTPGEPPSGVTRGESIEEDAVGEPDSEERPAQFRRGAKALVTASGSALLVRERHADGSPFWTLPGGGVHPGESRAAAVERELAEELRCRAVTADPLTAFPYAHTSSPGRVSVYTVHECHLLSEPTPVAAEGVSDIRWVSPSTIPTRTLPQVRTVVERALDP